MEFSVVYSKSAQKALKKMDRPIASLVLGWIEKNLINCSNPRALGKALGANYKEKWRYRVGDYRVIARIDDDKIIILVLEIGHRKEVYE